MSKPWELQLINTGYRQILRFDDRSENLRHSTEQNSNFCQYLKDHNNKCSNRFAYFFSFIHWWNQACWNGWHGYCSCCFVQCFKTTPQNAVKIDSVKLQKQHSHTKSKQSQTKNKISLFNTINPKKNLCHKKSIKWAIVNRIQQPP